MNKKVSMSVALAVTLIAMTVTFSVTMIISMSIFDRTVSSVVERQNQYSKLSELDKYVRANYYGEIDEETLTDRTAQGYVAGIGDKYGMYYTEREYSEMLAYEKGERVGVGIRVVKDPDGYFRIMQVFADSPADRAGLTRGGKITRVDEVDVKTIPTVKAINPLLRGEQGTTLKLTCLYGTEEMVFEVQRSNYLAPTVTYENVDGYAYFRIYAFGPDTYTDFNYLVSEAIGDGVRGFVFDVRNNTGENYRSAYDAIDMLCPLGIVAKSETKAGVVKNLATSDEECIDLPMTVLVNENTAAAAELFAVSVGDLNGGQIVGVRTAGKGMLQSPPQRLSDGSAVVITTAKLLTGRDESFDGVGITPDVEALMTREDDYLVYDPLPWEDPQILRSIDVLRQMILTAGGDAPELQRAPAGTEALVETTVAETSEAPSGADSSAASTG